MPALYGGYSKLGLLLQGAGAHASTACTDSGPDAIAFPTRVGTPIVTTAVSKFDGSALSFPGNSYFATGTVSLSKFAFGTGAWRIGFWLRVNNLSGSQGVFQISYPNGNLSLQVTSSGSLNLYPGLGGSLGQSATGQIAANTWYFITLGRVSNGYVYCYINGGNAFIADVGTVAAYGNATAVSIGGSPSSSTYLSGFLDDFFVEPGVQLTTSIPTDSWVPRSPRISGNVKNAEGVNAARSLYAYRLGVGMGSAVSDGTTGNYTLNVATTLPVSVIAVPDTGEALNALVLEGVVPA